MFCIGDIMNRNKPNNRAGEKNLWRFPANGKLKKIHFFLFLLVLTPVFYYSPVLSQESDNTFAIKNQKTKKSFSTSIDSSTKTFTEFKNIQSFQPQETSASSLTEKSSEGATFPPVINMINIPAGSFQMGSDVSFSNERPAHTVAVNAFQLSVTEITQGQYSAIIGINPSSYTWAGDYNPVENISWYDAVKFCNHLSQVHGYELCYDWETWECDFTKNGFRLPTEAEWEYACRAGTSTHYYTGDDDSGLGRVGWYVNNSNDYPHNVAQKRSERIGIVRYARKSVGMVL